MIFDSGDTGDAGGYQIANSLRCRASASAYLSRTFGTPTDARKWTASFRLKRGVLSVNQTLFTANGAADNANYGELWLRSDDTLSIYGWTAEFRNPAAKYRDPAGHDHITVVWDSTQAAEVDRIKIYKQGTQTPASALGLTVALNQTGPFNVSGKQHRIGISGTGGQPFDGLISEFHFIDGQALDPSYFGQFNSDGVWVPKAYTGTWGNNGFKLDFSNGTSLTTLGYDSSGNSNHWTLNNFSLTAGPTYDWLTDTPTNNYCTLNPNEAGIGSLVANGNLTWNGLNAKTGRGTIGMSSGKWYWEVQVISGGNYDIGIASYLASAAVTLGNDAYGWSILDNGNKFNNGTATAYFAGLTANDYVGVAFDADAGTLTFYKNNTSLGVAFSGLTSGPYFPAGTDNASVMQANFGQRPFQYTPPTGFKALCTANRGTGSITTSGTFTGNLNADGPCIWLNGNPESLTINGNAVTWGTHADKLAGGFKVRTASASYNASGSNTYSVTVTGKLFGDSTHAPNTAKGNP